MLNKPFQYDRPVFIRIPFFTRQKQWNHGEHFPWKEMNMPEDKILTLYNHGFLVHSEEQTVKMQVGDGLEVLDAEGLKEIVEDYNKRVKAITKTEYELKRRRCPSSLIAEKQRGLIRSWRRNNLEWLEKAETNK